MCGAPCGPFEKRGGNEDAPLPGGCRQPDRTGRGPRGRSVCFHSQTAGSGEIGARPESNRHRRRCLRGAGAVRCECLHGRPACRGGRLQMWQNRSSGWPGERRPRDRSVYVAGEAQEDGRRFSVGLCVVCAVIEIATGAFIGAEIDARLKKKLLIFNRPQLV